MNERLEGMIAYMPTVFDSRDRLDAGALRENLRRLIDSGLRAVYLMGSSGEFINVEPADYLQAVAIFVEEAGREVLKIVGCGSPRLRETIETARWLNGRGVDALLVVLPYFVPLNARERTHYLEEIAAACADLEIVHYNTRYAAAVRFDPGNYRELSDVSNFWGSKHGNMTPELWRKLRECGRGLRHLALEDGLVWTMKEGGWGVFSLVTSFSPSFALKWFEACRCGDWERTERMDREWAARRIAECGYFQSVS